MVWIDIVLLIIIVWFGYKGIRNGLIVELTSLVALIIAVVAALKYGNLTSELLTKHLSLEGSYLPFVSFVLTFLVVLILINFIGKLITKAIGVAQLGTLNRVLGLLFGFLKVGIILALLVNGFDRLNNTTELIPKQTINDSYLYQPLNAFAEKVYDFFDMHFDEVKEQFDKTLQNIEGTDI